MTMTGVFRGIPQFLQAMPEYYLTLGDKRFLPNPFKLSK
jgi:hypothetical protein